MNCHDLDHVLDAWLDERGAAERGRTLGAVDDHLRACERCRRRHGALLDWLERLERGPDVPLPDGLATPPTLTARPTRGWKRAAAAALAAAFLIAAGILLMRSKSEPTGGAGHSTSRPAPAASPLGALRRITPSRLERRETTIARVGSVRIRSVYRTLSGTDVRDLDAGNP